MLFLKARALSYKDDGNEEFKKGKYKKAIKVYTEGIKVNCSDVVTMSTLYANRANAHFKIGKLVNPIQVVRVRVRGQKEAGAQPFLLYNVHWGMEAVIPVFQPFHQHLLHHESAQKDYLITVHILPGNYRSSLNDATEAKKIQPGYIKAIFRGLLRLHNFFL